MTVHPIPKTTQPRSFLQQSLRGFLTTLLALAFSCAGLSLAESNATPSPTRQAELLNLVRQDCGSCHGLQLAGGLGLPLTPQALADKNPDALRATILYGRGGTPMPPWNPFLSEAEAGWIVETLMKGLP